MTAIIPQDNLARVSPTNHQVGMETSKADWHHRGLQRKSGERCTVKCLEKVCIFLKRKQFITYTQHTLENIKQFFGACFVQTQVFPWEGGQRLLLETWYVKSWSCHQVGIKPIWCTSLFHGLESLVYGHFPCTNKIVSELILILPWSLYKAISLRPWPHQVILCSVGEALKTVRWVLFLFFWLHVDF